MNKTITIDGPAGSGKSSISKIFAKRINYTYLETGSIYRTLTLFFIKQGVNPKDEEKIIEFIRKAAISVDKDNFFLDKEEVTHLLKSESVDKNVASFARSPEIRKFVHQLQIKIASEDNCVVAGRDIGTVIFPDAFCKFYLEASADVRTKRRFEELKTLAEKEGKPVKSLEDVRKEIAQRDYLDRTRKKSPLKIPPDALLIDSSNASIDEVLEQMVDYYNKQITIISDSSDYDSKSIQFLNALNAYDGNDLSFNSQSVIKAKVVSIDGDVLLDMGAKEDAYVAASEVQQLGKEAFPIGEEISVMSIGRTPRGLLTSKLKAIQESDKVELLKCFKEKKLVEGKVIEVVKGGFKVDVMGAIGFCPYSEYALKRVDMQEQVGTNSSFLIIDYDGRRNLIVSRKRPLEKQQAINREAFYEKVQPSDILDAKIVDVRSRGLLLEIEEGVITLLLYREYDWVRSKVSDEVSIGQPIKVKVVSIDREQKRVEVSRKLLMENPFVSFAQIYKKGDKVTGEVKRLEDYGAFIELKEIKGIVGLLHVSDISWVKKVEHAKDVLDPNQEVDLVIMKIDVEKHRLSLGLKQVLPNPWDTMEQLYPRGTVVSGTVTAVLENCIYCEKKDGLQLCFHKNDSRYKDKEDYDFQTKFKEGQVLEGKLLRVNKAKLRLELELQEKTGDPWKDLEINYSPGEVIRGSIEAVKEGGLDVRIGKDILGFCHVSQISDKEEPNLVADEVREGGDYDFVIQELDVAKKRLTLSRKKYIISQNKKDFKEYLNNVESEKRVPLSDFLS